MKKKQERQYKYKENSAFYLIDTEADILFSLPIIKCKVRNVKPSWYPTKYQPDYCFYSKTCMGYCNEDQMYPTLHHAKIAYLKKLNEDILEIQKECNAKSGKIIDKMMFISTFEPPEPPNYNKKEK